MPMHFQGIKITKNWLYINGIVYRVDSKAAQQFQEACRIIIPGDSNAVAYNMQTPVGIVRRALELSRMNLSYAPC